MACFECASLETETEEISVSLHLLLFFHPRDVHTVVVASLNKNLAVPLTIKSGCSSLDKTSDSRESLTGLILIGLRTMKVSGSRVRSFVPAEALAKTAHLFLKAFKNLVPNFGSIHRSIVRPRNSVSPTCVYGASKRPMNPRPEWIHRFL